MIYFTSWFISLYRYCLHICNLIMTSFPRKSSNRPSWSTMQNIRNDDRKVHDLCRSFRYLISWWHARRKLVYRVCTHLSLLYARSCCIQYEWLRWWYLSIYPIHCRGSNTWFDENVNSDPMLWGLFNKRTRNNSMTCISIYHFARREKPPGKCKDKLLAILYDKKRYVIHYCNLQQCICHGLYIS